MRKTDQAIISIITTAGRTEEKWEAARKTLGLNATLKAYDKKYPKLERSKQEKSKRRNLEFRSEWKKFKKNRSSWKSQKDYAKTKGIEPSEIQRRKATGECLRSTWPSDGHRFTKLLDMRHTLTHAERLEERVPAWD
jgi:hypothetical protein